MTKTYEDVINLYYLKIDQKKLNNYLLLMKSVHFEYLKEIDDMPNIVEKTRRMMGRILIVFILQTQKNMLLDDIIIHKNKDGKPYLHDNKYKFSLSHSLDYIVCAVSTINVGVDIEKMRVVDYFKISKCFFSNREYQILQKAESIELKSIFYEIWTLKEAYIKLNPVKLINGLKKPVLYYINSNSESNKRIKHESCILDDEYMISVVCESNGTNRVVYDRINDYDFVRFIVENRY